jgi:hypothetical protein
MAGAEPRFAIRHSLSATQPQKGVALLRLWMMAISRLLMYAFLGGHAGRVRVSDGYADGKKAISSAWSAIDLACAT